ncbi:hypothetical protein Tco_0323213 [Tanacetum coccineum]
MEKDRSIESNEVVDKNVVESSELNAVEPIELDDRKKEMEDGTTDKSVRSRKEELTGWETKAEVLVENPRSQPIGYYLKHEINEKLIEGLVDTHKYNDSLLATRLGKIDYETYNSLPARPMRILKWEERIKNHQEKEMGFNKWRSKVFDDENLTSKKEDSDVSNKGESRKECDSESSYKTH